MKNNKIKHDISVSDVIITAVVLFLLFLAPYTIFKGRSGGEKEKQLLIFKDSKEIKRAGLEKNDIISIDGLDLEIKDGRVRVIKSDCPREMCKNFGRIGNSGQTIVCAPKKILVEITGKTNEPEYNVVSY